MKASPKRCGQVERRPGPPRSARATLRPIVGRGPVRPARAQASRARSSIAGSMSTTGDLRGPPARGARPGDPSPPPAPGPGHRSVPPARGTGPGRPGRPRGRGRSSGRAGPRRSAAGPRHAGSAPVLPPRGLDQRRVRGTGPTRSGRRASPPAASPRPRAATRPRPGTRRSGRACPRRRWRCRDGWRAATRLTLPMSDDPASSGTGRRRAMPGGDHVGRPQPRQHLVVAHHGRGARERHLALAVGGQRGRPDQVARSAPACARRSPGRERGA